MILPGETEAGTAGTQPRRGIAWWAHRDDERAERDPFCASQYLIGSVDPEALKIPARRAEYPLAARGHELHHVPQNLVPQNLMELWVVRRVRLPKNSLALSIVEATSELMRLKSMFPLLPDTPAIYPVGRAWSFNSISSFREAGARCPAGRRHAGPWPHDHSHLRQDWIFPLRRH
jgi:hypothetical protein